MLSITSHKGFQMKFANGWTVSIQFGPGNYGSTRDLAWNAPATMERLDSATAEIAAWDADGKWFDFGNDKVAGYQTADEVAAFISKVSAF